MSYTPIPNPSKASFAELLAKQKQNAEAQTAHPNAELEALGIQGKTTIIPIKDKDGNPMFDKNGQPLYRQVFEATSIPAWYQRAIPVLERRDKCWFEGCEQIVEEYHQAIEQAKKNGGCSTCKKGAITREYLRKIQLALPAGELNKVAQPTTPPVKVVNKATGEIQRIPRKPVAYGTIKRVIPDELKAVFTNKQKERKLLTPDSETIEVMTTPAPQEVQLPDNATIRQLTGTSSVS